MVQPGGAAMKIDLDEIVLIARHALAEDHRWYMPEHEDFNIEEYPLARRHIESNSPPVTLALIARIRELEGTLRESIAHHRSVRDIGRDEGMLIDADEVNEETGWINSLAAVLSKGAILP